MILKIFMKEEKMKKVKKEEFGWRKGIGIFLILAGFYGIFNAWERPIGMLCKFGEECVEAVLPTVFNSSKFGGGIILVIIGGLMVSPSKKKKK